MKLYSKKCIAITLRHDSTGSLFYFFFSFSIKNSDLEAETGLIWHQVFPATILSILSSHDLSFPGRQGMVQFVRTKQHGFQFFRLKIIAVQ